MLLGPVVGQLEPGGFGQERPGGPALGIGMRRGVRARRARGTGIGRIRGFAAGTDYQAEGAEGGKADAGQGGPRGRRGREAGNGERAPPGIFPVGPAGLRSGGAGGGKSFFSYS